MSIQSLQNFLNSSETAYLETFFSFTRLGPPDRETIEMSFITPLQPSEQQQLAFVIDRDSPIASVFLSNIGPRYLRLPLYDQIS